MAYNPKIPAVVGRFSVDAARTEFIRIRLELKKLLSPEEDCTISGKEMNVIQSLDEKTLVEQAESLREKVAAQKRFLRHREEENSAQPTTSQAAKTSAEPSTSASEENPEIDAIMNSFSRLKLIVQCDEADQHNTSAGPSPRPLVHNPAGVPMVWTNVVNRDGQMEICHLSSDGHYSVVARSLYLPPEFKTFPSPWYMPLAFGWSRNLDENGDVVYNTPYEEKLRTMREVATYLQTYEAPACYTPHHLYIGLFTFSKLCDPRRAIPVDLAHPESFADFSQGHACPPVIIRKTPDNQPFPMLEYATEREISSAVFKAVEKELQSPLGCGCTDGCLDETKYACRQKTLTRLADECPKALRPINAFCEYGTLNERIPTGIYACNQKCACFNKPVEPHQPGHPVVVWPTCSNLVFHRGSAIPMEMYRHKDMGWAVRTLVDIPKGAFVVKYVGEVITDAEANRREDSTYFANLDFPLLGRKKPFVVDGKFYGNVAAFMNHSCEPNLFGQHVFADCIHDRLPQLAFFTGRDITAGEDLSWDYRYENLKRVPCKCGSEKCRGWLM